MNHQYAFINGNYVPFATASLPVSDLSIQRGYAVFDFFLVRNGIPPYLSYHLDRLMRSVAVMGLDLKYSREEISAIVLELVGKNGLKNSSVKIIVTGGVSADDFTPSTASLLVINKPFEIPVTEASVNGGKLITAAYQRETPEAKTINYLRSVSLASRITEAGAVEVLYHSRNKVRECSRSNVYMVKNGVIYSPKSRVLAGVTRRRILELDSVSLKLQDFSMEELLSADEVFITSTTKGVMPIVRVDDHIIADGKPGPVTSMVRRLIMTE